MSAGGEGVAENLDDCFTFSTVLSTLLQKNVRGDVNALLCTKLYTQPHATPPEQDAHDEYSSDRS